MPGLLCFMLSNIIGVMWAAYAEAYILMLLQVYLCFINRRECRRVMLISNRNSSRLGGCFGSF